MSDGLPRWINHTFERAGDLYIDDYYTTSGIHVRTISREDGAAIDSKLIIDGAEFIAYELDRTIEQLHRDGQLATRRLCITHQDKVVLDLTYEVELPWDYDLVMMFPWEGPMFWDEFDDASAISNHIDTAIFHRDWDDD